MIKCPLTPKKSLLILIIALAVFIPLLINTVYKSSLPPLNDFPLSDEPVKSAMQTEGLNYRVEKQPPSDDPLDVHVLYNKDEKMIAFFGTAVIDDAKSLQFIMLHSSIPPGNLMGVFPKEDWQKGFSAACRLYGGFSNPNKVYEKFMADAKDGRYENLNGNVNWEKKIDGIYCKVGVVPFKQDPKQFEISAVILMNEAAYNQSKGDT